MSEEKGDEGLNKTGERDGRERESEQERDTWLNVLYHFHPCENPFRFQTSEIRLPVVSTRHFSVESSPTHFNLLQ